MSPSSNSAARVRKESPGNRGLLGRLPFLRTWTRRLKVLILRDDIVAVAPRANGSMATWQGPLTLHDGRPDLAALATWLEETSGRGGRIDLLLSGHYLRADVLPWQPALLRDDDTRLLAADKLTQRFGNDLHTGWHISLGPARPGRSRLVCALPQAWYNTAETLAEIGFRRVERVEPLFSAVFDRVCRQLPRDCLLGIAEPGRLTLARIDGEDWKGIHSRAVPLEPDALPELVAQGRALLGAHQHPLRMLTLGDMPTLPDAHPLVWPVRQPDFHWLEAC